MCTVCFFFRTVLTFISHRSWASQLRIMERHPEYKFGASQAQQYDWIKENYPSLFKEIQQASQRKQWDILGGTWVEMVSIYVKSRGSYMD
jgi:alpha-mannosidase